MKTGMRDIILLGAGQLLGDTQSLGSMIDSCHMTYLESLRQGDCKNDHGDRTNHKLKDQPFYARNKTGKMKSW